MGKRKSVIKPVAIDRATLDHLQRIVEAAARDSGTASTSPLSCQEVLMLIQQAGEAEAMQAMLDKVYNHNEAARAAVEHCYGY